MADDPPAPRKKKKLPPVTAQTENETTEPKKPVRRKKKKPVEEGETAPTTKPTDGTPRKKKKLPARTEDTASPKQENGETPAAPTPRKRKKKKPVEKTDDIEEPTTGRSAENVGEDVTGSKKSLLSKEAGTPKKKVKKKVKKTPSATLREGDELLDATLTGDLTAIQEDVVTPRDRSDGDGQEDDETDIHHPYSTESAVLKSQPLQKIFIETETGFKGENKSKMIKRLTEEKQLKSEVAPEVKKSTIEFALGTHRFLRTIFLFLHGLTAGISMWQIMFTYILLYFDYIDFIEHYRVLALPVQCLFYMLLVLCMVSACDRFDVGNINRRFILHSITMQTGTVAVFIYMAALIVSLCTANLEDKINLYAVNSTLWEDTVRAESDVDVWVNLNTARCVLAIVGWLVISIVPNTDRLADNLRKGDDNILGNTVEMLDASHRA